MNDNKRMIDFRKRNQKIDTLNAQQANRAIQTMNAVMFQIMAKIGQIEERAKAVYPLAKAADFRSLALARLVKKAGIVTQQEIDEETDKVLIENFEIESIADDKAKGLESVEGPAKKDQFAIFNLKLFKDGKELKEQEVPRGKIELGKHEEFPELDDNLLGMTVGESKKSKLNLMGQTDEGLFTLLGLRQKRIIAPKEGEHVKIVEDPKDPTGDSGPSKVTDSTSSE